MIKRNEDKKMLLNVRRYIILGTHFTFYCNLPNKSIFEIIYLIVHKNVFGHSIFYIPKQNKTTHHL